MAVHIGYRRFSSCVALSLVLTWAVAATLKNQWSRAKFWGLYLSFVLMHLAVFTKIGWDAELSFRTILLITSFEGVFVTVGLSLVLGAN
jgi:hypothetical protein